MSVAVERHESHVVTGEGMRLPNHNSPPPARWRRSLRRVTASSVGIRVGSAMSVLQPHAGDRADTGYQAGRGAAVGKGEALDPAEPIVGRHGPTGVTQPDVVEVLGLAIDDRVVGL